MILVGHKKNHNTKSHCGNPSNTYTKPPKFSVPSFRRILVSNLTMVWVRPTPEMEIGSNQSTKSYGTQRHAINKVIWYAAARNQQSHLVRAWRPWRSCCWHLVRPPSGRPNPLPVEEILSDAWSRDHPHRSPTVVRTASVLSGSVRCAPGSVETCCCYGSTDVLADAMKNN